LLKKFKTTNKIYLILILLAILVNLIGCSNEKDSVSSSDGKKILQMYVYSHDIITLNAIGEFNKSSKITINPNLINDNNKNDIDNNIKKTSTSILAGEGPDIIIDYASVYPSLWKIVQNDVFCDLNEYIRKNKDFNLSEYNSKVIDCGVINDKRYFIPVTFSVPLIWSSDSLLHKNNIKINENKWSWEEYGKLCNKYIDINSNKEKYFIGNSFSFQSIMESCWQNYVNYSKKESYFDTDEFVRLLKVYKSTYLSILPDTKLKAPELFFEFLKNNSLLLVNCDISVYYMWINNTAVNKILESDMSCFPYPTESLTQQPSAHVKKFIAINKSCKYKDEAFEFIKLIISEKYQNSGKDIFGLPVNIKAYRDIINECAGENGSDKSIANFSSGQIPYTSLPLSEKTLNRFDSLINSIEDCAYVDNNIMGIIDEEVAAYLAGRQNEVQTAKSINDRVQIYMNE
jgi:multiple sugar transport system substrate-binding protein